MAIRKTAKRILCAGRSQPGLHRNRGNERTRGTPGDRPGCHVARQIFPRGRGDRTRWALSTDTKPRIYAAVHVRKPPQPVRARREHHRRALLPTGPRRRVIHQERPVTQQGLDARPFAASGYPWSQVALGLEVRRPSPPRVLQHGASAVRALARALSFCADAATAVNATRIRGRTLTGDSLGRRRKRSIPRRSVE